MSYNCREDDDENSPDWNTHIAIDNGDKCADLYNTYGCQQQWWTYLTSADCI